MGFTQVKSVKLELGFSILCSNLFKFLPIQTATQSSALILGFCDYRMAFAWCSGWN